MLLVIHITLASAIVESGLTAFGLELSQTQITHFSRAFEGHAALVLGENFVILRWDHLVLAFNPTEAGEQKVFNRRKINSHFLLLLRCQRSCGALRC